MKINSTHVNELIILSKYYGSDNNFVIAGGGNTSVKTDDSMLVKASGFSLATITEEGFVATDRSKLLEIFNKNYPDSETVRESMVLKNLMAAKIDSTDTKRPSVETLLHGLLPQKFIVHTHPAIVNGVTCSKNGEKTVKKLFGSKAAWIPYTDPGYKLALAVKEALNKVVSIPDIIFMQNHGLIIGGDSPSEVKRITSQVIAKISTLVKKEADFSDFDKIDQLKIAASQIAPVIRMAISDHEKPVVQFSTNTEFISFLKSSSAFKNLTKPFTPDHIVYCSAYPCFVSYNSNLSKLQLNVIKAIKQYKLKYNIAPKIVAIQNIGVFTIGKNSNETRISQALFMDSIKIAVYATSYGGIKPMNSKQTRFITQWEAESYRKKVSLGSANGIERLHGKVALITGGAQGFGKGLAESLLKEGAHVAIADKNFVLAKQVADEFSLKYGRAKAIAIGTDVGNDTSVKKMVCECVCAFGGIDIFISNAGILKAGSIQELNPSDFELVTKVNYTAYYLCVRHVSELMKLQNKFAGNSYWSDIIQINSKSGLTGSKANFAYAGSKFGGIGLTQSFALELVDHNIKVNSICPGNLFNGPLWSDPVNGLFVQYLKAKKVPGAKTVSDVRKFYESKVPMRRGCEVSDVAKAVLYVCEQKYETGQALPVTGGQTMLN